MNVLPYLMAKLFLNRCVVRDYLFFPAKLFVNTEKIITKISSLWTFTIKCLLETRGFSWKDFALIAIIVLWKCYCQKGLTWLWSGVFLFSLGF